MSAMLRAYRSGGAPLNPRRGRSLSDGSSSSDDSDDAGGGARLSNAGSPLGPKVPSNPKVRFSSITQEFSHISIASSVASGGSARDPIESSPFQVGKTPSGDIFMASPKQTPLKLGHAIPARIPFIETDSDSDYSPIKAGEDRRLTRAVTTGNALVLDTLGDRNVNTNSRHQIGGIDVQGIYPASSCVFVANLPEKEDDVKLEVEVTKVFNQYGTVFIKIRRDHSRMPFAFCQYTNDDDAKLAMKEGKGAMILGRPCRTEPAKANRSYVIYSLRGEGITTAIAREILEPYGEISKCELLSVQIQEAMKLPQAVFVEFAAFDPKRDLNSAVEKNDGYSIDAFDVKKKKQLSRADADEEYLSKYDVNRRSVFVGGVPVDTDEEEMIDFFSEVGDVVNVDIVKRTTHAGHSYAFAFVEFSRADLPDVAIKNLHATSMRGSTLKVERKVFKNANTPRRVKSQTFSTNASTNPMTPRFGAAVRSPRAFGVRQSSSKKITPALAAQIGHSQASGGQQFRMPEYPMVAPIPAPVNGQPVLGASGLPCSPSNSPFQAINPYPYNGGYWPGFSSYQDPYTGLTYYAYTPSPAAVQTATIAERIAETPTRGRTREQRHYSNGA